LSAALTEKLGVRSSWKGQRPVQRAPALRSCVRPETTSTISAAEKTSLTEVSLIRDI